MQILYIFNQQCLRVIINWNVLNNLNVDFGERAIIIYETLKKDCLYFYDKYVKSDNTVFLLHVLYKYIFLIASVS